MESTIQLAGVEESRLLFGAADANLRLVRDACSVDIVARNGILKIRGEEANVEEARRVFEEMLGTIREGRAPGPGDLERLLTRRGRNGTPASPRGSDPIAAVDATLVVRPKSEGQARYLEAMRSFDIVFGIGPAGTGKTFLAVAMAVAYLRAGIVRRIILTRPAVEAGEHLGFLPGDFLAKVNPFVRPLYDALSDLLSHHQIQKYLEKDVVEVIPLAYMRGRTLDRAFIILDEAQNTTTKQMKMFLTRLGMGSKAVITGDITQVDIADTLESGLVAARRILADVRNIAFCILEKVDIVRHPLVQEIVDAYERLEQVDRQV